VEGAINFLPRLELSVKLMQESKPNPRSLLLTSYK